MNVKDSFGTWLRQRRKALDLTQFDLADQVGCSVVTIRKIEADERRPSKQIVERLADVLAVSLEERAEFVAYARHTEDIPAAPPLRKVAVNAPHNLPLLSTSFVGRTDELALIAERLADPRCRLLTLVGAGGIGKTRLALQAAAEQLPNFANGVYFVSLTGVSSPTLVASAIAGALQMSFFGADSPDVQLVNYLRHKTMLLVLDNFEHLLGATGLLTDILAAAPSVKLLTTSRERLNVQEEWVVAVEGLAFPRSPDPASLGREREMTNSHLPFPHQMGERAGDRGIEGYSAVQLFVQRARQVQATFSWEQNAEAVLAICRAVEGMPLGLELAASWLRVMTCSRIADQLAHSLDFLSTSARNALERHRSIRAVFDYSWKALTSDEQAVFRKLAVFRGGFEREAAEQVTGANLAVLTSLVDKSLIRMDRSERFSLHELVRQYATDKLVAQDEMATTANGHLNYFLSLAERIEADIYRPRQIVWFDRLESERDNLSAALAWSLSGGDAEVGLRLAGALGWFWQLRYHEREGCDWSMRLLDVTKNAPASIRAKALHRVADMIYFDEEQARMLTEEALHLARIANDRWNEAWSLASFKYTRQLDVITDRLETALAIFRALGDGWGISHCLRRLGLFLTKPGHSERSTTFAEEALTLARAAGDKSAEAWSLAVLGRARHIACDFARAASLYHESLPLFHEIRDKGAVTFVLVHLGKVAFDQTDNLLAQTYYEHALIRMLDSDARWGWNKAVCLVGLGVLCWRRGCILQAAKVLGGTNAYLDSEPDARTYYFDLDQQMAETKSAFDQPLFTEAWAVGKTMSLEQLVGCALEG